jgi:hypothetical protein
MRESFTYYKSFAEGLKPLNDETYRRLSDALINYALYDEAPDLEGLEMTVFQSWKANIDASNRRKDNGKNGGRPKTEKNRTETENNRTKPKITEGKPNKKEKENKKETITETKKESIGRFTPPTPDQVREYIAEKGYSVDAEKFVDFYESKGWFVGKNKMKDWKAAVRNWARSQRQESTTKGSRTTNRFNNFEPSGTDWDAVADRIMGAHDV